jgi:hypothetical protein
MRKWLAAAALLLSACSEPAPVDMTARYANGSGRIVVQAAANGDARVETGGQTLVRRGGTEYLVAEDARGRFAVPLPEAIAAMDEIQREAGVKPLGLGPQPDYALTRGGSETVAGVKGVLWKAHPSQVPSLTSAEAVISEDPAHRTLAAALAMQTRLGAAGMAQVQGGVGNLETRIAEMLGKGLVLRFNATLRLEKIEAGPIAAAEFALPAAVLSRAAFKARLGGRPADPAPAAASTKEPR